MLYLIFIADADPSLGIFFGLPPLLYQPPSAASGSHSLRELCPSPAFHFQLGARRMGLPYPEEPRMSLTNSLACSLQAMLRKVTVPSTGCWLSLVNSELPGIEIRGEDL